jgi:hypothetical protein
MSVTYQDDLKQHLLIHLHELLVPFIDISGLATGIVVITSARGVILVVSTPLDDLLQDGLIHLPNGEGCKLFTANVD